MKPLLILPCFFLVAMSATFAQSGKPIPRPKLVVGIVVDQMRYDFLYRYWKYYGEGGFKRLVNKGYSFEQAHFSYAPTVTGPGHASVYTGTSPAWHGIVGNHWYDRLQSKVVYCASAPDTAVRGLGQEAAMSPQQLLSTTLGDEIKNASVGQAKVIGIALKDRGAIFPAGHRADAAYWFNSKTGNWVSSSYYFAALPAWVASFNQAKSVQRYVKAPWEPLGPLVWYKEGAGADSSLHEGQLTAGSGTQMPVNLPTFFKDSYELVAASALGSAATTDFALTALEAEQLGQRGQTDMLCLSYSSTDLVGHTFGPDSWECMDAYLRLDKEIERLLQQIDKTVGLQNTLLFLTADHGVAPIPSLAKSLKLPGGTYKEKDIETAANTRLAERFGPEIKVLAIQGEQLYLDRGLLRERKISLDDAAASVADALRTLPFVQNAWAAWALKAAAVTDPYAKKIAMGVHPARSGDIFLQTKAGYIQSNGSRGTGHGSPYAYDTHVPMLFFGWGIKPGQTVEPVSITDIAPTVSALLKIMEPSASTGTARPILRGK